MNKLYEYTVSFQEKLAAGEIEIRDFGVTQYHITSNGAEVIVYCGDHTFTFRREKIPSRFFSNFDNYIVRVRKENEKEEIYVIHE
jgi:hypothetical protein